MSEEHEGRDHEPSQKKLDDARSRGDVARSADLTAAAASAGLLIAALVFGRAALPGFGEAAQAFLERAGRSGFASAGGSLALGRWLALIVLPLAPFFVLPGLAAALALIGQRAIVFSGEKLRPQLSRLDPVRNAGHKFGRAGLAEFAKSTVKFALVGVLLGWFLIGRLPQALQTMALGEAQVSALTLRFLTDFLLLATAVSLALGALDYLWQRAEHLRRNRMTRQEVMEEFRDSEGDPQLKGARRQRAQEIAMNRMLADVPKADVVVVNPTHYAVALKWSRAGGRAPVCVAKGADAVAARIREAASVAGVPIRSDPPTARALYAAVEVGSEIAPEHYAPVAAAIRYAERMRRRARARRGGR
jgi:flagellar biosynthetic protein FlhB